MAQNKLGLYFGENKIGELTESSQHQIYFQYDRGWIETHNSFAISQSLPLRPEIYSEEAQNYFANLLPEGDVRLAVASRIGISSENDFRLLAALGGECAGALTVGEKPHPISDTYTEIKINDIKKLFGDGQIVLSAVQNEKADIRLSLAGAQDKVPVLFKDKKLFLPRGNSPSSHLLKLPNQRVAHLPENEYLMHSLAKKMGLPVAATTLYQIGEFRACLVERYDRVWASGKLLRLHQEDYCQALGYSHKTKYEKDGGPRFSQCYEITERASVVLPEDLETLTRWVVFNVLIGNCDAHAKNISFVMSDKKEWKLSPHYDLVCTLIYPRLSKKLAMSIGGSEDPGTVTGTHWDRLAKEVRMGTRFLRDLVLNMSEDILNQWMQTTEDFSKQYGNTPAIEMISKVLYEQQKRMLTQLKK
jgi:serine/threonine-protein kinase HipA